MKALFALVAIWLVSAPPTQAQSIIRWVGGNGDWSNRNNWNPVGLPGTLDTVEIGADGNYRVTVDLNDVTVASVRIGYPSASTFSQELYLEGKTFTATDSISVRTNGKLMLWNNSTMNGAGSIINRGTLLIKQSAIQNDLVNVAGGYVEGYSHSSLNGRVVNEGFLGTYGTYGYGSGFLTVAEGFTNAGTIRIWGDNTGSIVGDATLIVSNGPLVNNGQLIVGGTEMYGGDNFLKAALVNNDSMIIYGRPLSLDKTGAQHVNNGFIHLVNSSLYQREFTVKQSGPGSQFSNNGIIQIDNNCKMSFSSGVLNINSNHIRVGGILVVKDTCLVNLNVDYTNQDTSIVEIRNLAEVNGPGVVTNRGTLSLYAGSINGGVRNTSSGYIQAFGRSSLNGDVTNEGFLGAYGTYGYGSAFLTFANGFINEGTLRLWGDNTGSVVGDATVLVSNGNLVNNRKIISGGSEDYGGTNYLRASLINNDTTIISGRFFVLEKPDANHVNNGFIHFMRSSWHQREFDLIQSGSSPSFENFGTFKIDSTNVLRLTRGRFINQPSGVLTGIGSINSQNGLLTNEGLVVPGDNVGTFSVIGNYPEDSTSVLRIDLGGYASGTSHDRLRITGAASFNGTLSVRFVNGFIPAIGDSFQIVTYDSRSGFFRNIVDSNLTPSTIWATVYTPNSLYIRLISPAGVEEDEVPDIPTEYALDQNFPNPFNPHTTIRYALPQRSHVILTVHNIIGQLIALIAHGERQAGRHDVHFDASGLASGTYFYRLHATGYTVTKKFTVLR